jgi:SAM-dependent methyltransferase
VAKPDEIAYAARMNAGHAANKPFSDADCGRYLVRIGTILALLPPPPARVLDLGCGTGWTSLFFARAGHRVVGVDIAPEMIRLAEEQRAAAGLSGAAFRASDYESLAYRGEFDAVVFFDSLHHAEDERLAVSRAFDALKPGGVLLADEPGEGHSQAEASRSAVAEYGVTEKDMPPAHVVALGRAAGFAGFRVFPHAHELSTVVYGRRAEPAADPFAHLDPRWEAGPAAGTVAKLLRRASFALSPYPAWRLSDVDHLLLHIRTNGLVMMWKGAAEQARAAA